jgi:predicted CoA-binding protein
MKKIVVLGASPNPERYSYKAVQSLLKRNYTVIAVGVRHGFIGSLPIFFGLDDLTSADTLLLYIGPAHQKEYYKSIIKLRPGRIIFNPGTENPELIHLCKKARIEVVLDCSLDMLSKRRF